MKKWLYWKIVDEKYICKSDEFILSDLKVVIVDTQLTKEKQSLQQDIFTSRHWYYFEVIGENIYLPEWQPFSIYDLSSVLPLLAAKQRVLSDVDRMSSDNIIAVPDPYCKYGLKIIRTWLRCFSRNEVTDNEI